MEHTEFRALSPRRHASKLAQPIRTSINECNGDYVAQRSPPPLTQVPSVAHRDREIVGRDGNADRRRLIKQVGKIQR
eukprot:6212878-Pleurochrysis_carterae.AAC.2